jgi:hypothetical protein
MLQGCRQPRRAGRTRGPIATLQLSNVKLPVAIGGTLEGDTLFLITTGTGDRPRFSPRNVQSLQYHPQPRGHAPLVPRQS